MFKDELIMLLELKFLFLFPHITYLARVELLKETKSMRTFFFENYNLTELGFVNQNSKFK